MRTVAVVVVVVVVAAFVTLGDTANRERRQSSGCFWWNGDCDKENANTQADTPSEPVSDSAAPRDGDQSTVRQHHQHQEYQDYASCDNFRGVCVPYYLCRNDSIVTDGAGIIDIR